MTPFPRLADGAYVISLSTDGGATTDEADTFYRLYGDLEGYMDVNDEDQSLFSLSSEPGQSSYEIAFDLNNTDSEINLGDFNAFGTNYADYHVGGAFTEFSSTTGT